MNVMAGRDLVEDCVLNASVEEAEEQELAWVREFEKSWSNVVFDESGGRLLRPASASKPQFTSSASRKTRDMLAVRRGLIRNLYLIVDFTSSMLKTDYKPSRIEYLLDQLCTVFLPRFFELNPLSSVAVISLRDHSTTFISRLTAQPKGLIRRLLSCGLVPSGGASLQKALDLVTHALPDSPSYAAKEVLILWGSLGTAELRPSSCSPGSSPVRISVLSLEPELFALRRLAEASGGSYQVCVSPGHCAQLLGQFITPSVSASARPQYIKMGFPVGFSPAGANCAVKCACHLRPAGRLLFQCPQCQALVCEIPGDCPVCRLPLAHADALAGVHRHLYVLAGFSPVAAATVDGGSDGGSFCCFACGSDGDGDDEDEAGEKLQCGRCKRLFCRRCAEFAEHTLLHCVGCSLGISAGSSR